MVTVSHVVKKIVSRNALIHEAMQRGILSFTALAETIRPEIEKELGKKVKNSAIIMALRRLAEKLEENAPRPSFHYFMETIKTDICYIVVKFNPRLLSKIQKICSFIEFDKGGMLNIIQGNYEISIITNQRYKDRLLDLLEKEEILKVIDNLVSISLQYSEEYLSVPGVVYDISRFLAWENINIIDIILTRTELSLIVDKKDMIKCYSILEKFAEK